MKKETETIEFKKSISELKEGIISIVSILNKHKSGELYFGINNKGNVTKQTITEKTLRDISQTIASHIEPRIYSNIEVIKLDNIECIKISFKGKNIPYFAYGRAYIRVADEDKLLSAKELENIILRKEQTKWDSKKADIALKDINEKILKRYINKANAAGRINFKYTTKEKILKKLNLYKNKSIINATEVLFSKHKPLEVQAAVFAGTDKTTFLDIKQFKGNIFELLEISESYIKEHIDWRADLSTGTRKEIPEVPIRAITEVLVNSLCHKNYQAPESNKIAIYKDKIEVWNTGNFPEGYKPEDFIKKEIPSVLRNPTIANIMYLSKDIEKWGSGIKRIYDVCKENNVKVKFNIMRYGFSVVFDRSTKVVEETTQKTTPQATPQVTPQANRQVLILNFCKIIRSREEIQKHIQINDRVYFRLNILNPLIKDGLIELTLPDKPNSPNQKYKITKKGQDYIKTRKYI